jgi:hypothetical protein
MGNGAIQPLAATPGPLRVLCGATLSSLLLGEGLTSWRRKRRRIPVLDGTQPSNTKFGSNLEGSSGELMKGHIKEGKE